MAAISPAPQPKSLKGWILALSSVLAAAVTALVLVLVGIIPGVGAAGASTNDLVLEGADAPGVAAFMVADLVNPSSLITPIKKGAPVPALNLTTEPASGGAPGLYGGSGTDTCNPGQLVSFLGQNPDKAAAWVAALNADPMLSWGTGQALTVAEIPVYVANMIPGVLQKDTWVTNHGFDTGSARPFQSMLQRGTAVLFDRHGVPRVRCLCGNPLLPPQDIDPPNVTGDPWEELGELPPEEIIPTDQPQDEFDVIGEDGELITVTSAFCSGYAAGACPAPGPGNATSSIPAPANPTGGQASGDLYQNPNPAPPQYDSCTSAVGNYTDVGDVDVPMAIENTTGADLDIWVNALTWDENRIIVDCQMEYLTSVRAGAFTPDWTTRVGADWSAVDQNTGAIVSTTRSVSGATWSIQ